VAILTNVRSFAQIQSGDFGWRARNAPIIPQSMTLALVVGLAIGGAWLLISDDQHAVLSQPRPAASQPSSALSDQEPQAAPPGRSVGERPDSLRAVLTDTDDQRVEPSPASKKVTAVSGTAVPVSIAPADPAPLETPEALPGPLPAEVVRAAMQKATAAVRPVSAAEVEQLIMRSGTLISQGNIAGARLVLERAAAGRSGEALLQLAKTYDATALAQWRAIGVKPDPGKARDLYRQAAKLGVKDGPEKVAVVAQSTMPSRPR
jgi:hypothetical protein